MQLTDTDGHGLPESLDWQDDDARRLYELARKAVASGWLIERQIFEVAVQRVKVAAERAAIDEVYRKIKESA